MKKIATMIGALAALLVFAAAACAADDVIGYVERGTLLQGSPKYAQAVRQLNSIANKKQQESKAAFDKEKDEKKKSLIFQNFQADMRIEEDKLMAPVIKEIDAAIERAAKQKGVTIVMERSLVLFGGVDLTQDVLNILKLAK